MHWIASINSHVWDENVQMKTSAIDLREMTLNHSLYYPEKVQSNAKERRALQSGKKREGKNDYVTFVFILATLKFWLEWADFQKSSCVYILNSCMGLGSKVRVSRHPNGGGGIIFCTNYMKIQLLDYPCFKTFPRPYIPIQGQIFTTISSQKPDAPLFRKKLIENLLNPAYALKCKVFFALTNWLFLVWGFNILGSLLTLPDHLRFLRKHLNQCLTLMGKDNNMLLESASLESTAGKSRLWISTQIFVLDHQCSRKEKYQSHFPNPLQSNWLRTRPIKQWPCAKTNHNRVYSDAGMLLGV